MFEYINFDKCIEYIVNSKFNIKEWCLLEIPLSNIYTFYNANRKEFNDIMLNNLERFDVTDNKPAQSCSYIAVEVTDEV